jgi:mono/diheme cytochrome c family protein
VTTVLQRVTQAACVLALGSAAVLAAQASTSAHRGLYSTRQSQRGKALYASQCAMCHGDDLSGMGPSPALTGEDFMAKWKGQPVSALFSKIKMTMPQSHPGSLTGGQAADLVAFILHKNGLPGGTTPLAATAAGQKGLLISKH